MKMVGPFLILVMEEWTLKYQKTVIKCKSLER
jgi:hypothetical protein